MIPPKAGTISCPRMIELAFQAAGLVEMGKNDRMGLPAGLSSVFYYGQATEDQALYARVSGNTDGYFVELLDPDGTVYIRVDGYKTAELAGALKQEDIVAIKALF